MRKLVILLSVAALLGFFTASCLWAGDFKCPPDEKAVKAFCDEKYKDKAGECVKAILASDCDLYKVLVEKAENEKAYGTRLKHCSLGGGNLFGCAFWMMFK